jgi:hypothetical protein
MNYPYSSSYTSLQPSPSPSDIMTTSSPSPPPSNSSFHPYLPLPIPVSSSSHSHNGNQYNHFQRQSYPTSTPYHRHQSSPDPSPSSKGRLPPITSSFTNGYASPATSSYSSEPGSRDEIDLTEPGGSNSIHGHVNLPGVDGIMLRGDGMFLDSPGPRGNEHRDREYHRRWNMRDFTLVQTVGM